MGAKSFRMGLILSFLSVGAFATPACGGSDEDEGGPAAGSGGKGGSAGSSAGTSGKGGTSGAGGSAEGGMVSTKDCKGQMCKGAELPAIIQMAVPGQTEVAPCCAGANGDKCGLDTSLLEQLGVRFPEVCQEKNQPGNEDANCPKQTFAIMGFNLSIPGCCRPNGKCGYLANKIGVPGVAEVQFDLGCVDSTPFLDGGTAPDCSGGGDGSGGSGGSSSDASSDVSTD
jgi:hypothetical protein